jgi:hypothetical protein
MERTVVMDKSKGEPVISVKATSRSKDRVSIDRQISEFEASLVCREFQDNQSYTEKPCLQTKIPQVQKNLSLSMRYTLPSTWKVWLGSDLMLDFLAGALYPRLALKF